MNKLSSFKNKIKKILCKRGGFTLTELLIAALIMAISTAALTSVMVLAVRHFYKTTQRTEAQLLCAALSEFVEDELLFSKVSVTTEDGLTWSNGTHNMGSKISFYVNDGTYTKIDDSTINKYGKIYISGDNLGGGYFSIVSEGSYQVEAAKGYDLLAGMSLSWDETYHWYVVEIAVVDKDDKTVLSDQKFTVKPAKFAV